MGTQCDGIRVGRKTGVGLEFVVKVGLPNPYFSPSGSVVKSDTQPWFSLRFYDNPVHPSCG
jgi:hypothetical protein